MSQKCCVVGCKSQRKNGDSSTPHLFKLPKARERLEEWLSVIGRYDILKRIILLECFHYQLWLRVCEKHFKKHEIRERNHMKVLSPKSVPSLNLPSPEMGITYVKHKLIRTYCVPPKIIHLNLTALEIINIPPPDSQRIYPWNKNATYTTACHKQEYEDKNLSHVPNSQMPFNLTPQVATLSLPVPSQLSPAPQTVIPALAASVSSHISPAPQTISSALSLIRPQLSPATLTVMPGYSIPLHPPVPQPVLPTLSMAMPVYSQISPAPQTVMSGLSMPISSPIRPSLCFGGAPNIMVQKPPMLTIIPSHQIVTPSTYMPAPQMNFGTPFGGTPIIPTGSITPYNLMPTTVTPSRLNFPIATNNIPVATTASTQEQRFLELTLSDIENILKTEIPKQEQIFDNVPDKTETKKIILVEDGDEGESLEFKTEQYDYH